MNVVNFFDSAEIDHIDHIYFIDHIYLNLSSNAAGVGRCRQW
jgi:hypothetical protein